MEYCEAGSVQDLVKVRKKQLTEDQIAAICAQVVLGLVYLHSNHIMHRDIKAGNILLTLQGKAKLGKYFFIAFSRCSRYINYIVYLLTGLFTTMIADFGVSTRLEGTFQKKNTVIGSPYWMAPECAPLLAY